MSSFESFKLLIIVGFICYLPYNFQFKIFKKVVRARFVCALSF